MAYVSQYCSKSYIRSLAFFSNRSFCKIRWFGAQILKLYRFLVVKRLFSFFIPLFVSSIWLLHKNPNIWAEMQSVIVLSVKLQCWEQFLRHDKRRYNVCPPHTYKLVNFLYTWTVTATTVLLVCVRYTRQLAV